MRVNLFSLWFTINMALYFFLLQELFPIWDFITGKLECNYNLCINPFSVSKQKDFVEEI